MPESACSLLAKSLLLLPDVRRISLARTTQRASLKVTMLFYKLGKVFLTSNEELGRMIEQHCIKSGGRLVFMMRRGVDTDLFSPAKGTRQQELFTIGYVGRMTPEKNVRLLAELENG